MSSRRLIVALTLSAIAGMVTVFLLPKPLPELSRSELIAEVRSGYVRNVVVIDGELLTGISTRRGQFRVVLQRGDKSLIGELTAMGVAVTYERTPLGLI